MVREARFCWDDSDGREPPLDQRRLDEFDDELLDPDPPSNRVRQPQTAEGRLRQRKRLRREEEADRRHLAGADWLGSGPVPRDDEAA